MEEKIRDGTVTLIYDIARPEDVDEAAAFAAESLYNSSPIKEIASFDDPSDEAGRIAWNKGRLQTAFSNPTCIIVREKTTGDVVGFVTMKIEERDDGSNSTTFNYSDDRSAGWLTRAISAELNRGIDLYTRYETNRILFIWFGAIRDDYRGEKLFYLKPFRDLTKRIIRENVPGAVKAITFSNYSAVGKDWEIIKTIDFESFELPDGTRPLAGVDLGGHRTAKLKGQKLPLMKHHQPSTKTPISRL